MSIKLNNQTIAGNKKYDILIPSSQTKAGIIRIATQEEVNDGTDNFTAVTPRYLSQKQNKLVAGDGIEIIDNTISSTSVTFRKWD